MRNYIELCKIFPYPVVTSRYVITKTTFNKSDLDIIKKSWHPKRFEKYGNTFVEGKDYVVLFDKSTNQTMMSSHEFEMITNQKFLDNAKGDVLIFGLGIGLIVYPLLKDENINSITIVEVDKDLISEIFPLLAEFDYLNRLEVKHSDAFKFETDKKFDTIYFDIWASIGEEAFNEMDILSNMFRKNLKEEGWMDSWCSEEINYELK
jgi:spermidine synthase